MGAPNPSPLAYPSPLRLLHETSPWVALQVARTGQFKAGPILGDAGLNAVMENHPKGKFNPDQAASCGAIIEFEWSGPITMDKYISRPEIDCLYDQHPHRLFLFVGSSKHLRLVRVDLKHGYGWEAAVVPPTFDRRRIFDWDMWRQWGASRLNKRWVLAQARNIEKEISSLIAKRPFIEIVKPSYAPYLHLLDN